MPESREEKEIKKIEEIDRIWGKIMAKAWSDEDFKKKLLSNPTEVLQEYGLVDSQTKAKVYENSDAVMHFVIVEKPQGNLSVKELEKIAAAGTGSATAY